jgi:rhamnulose-1-phosphate aldolase/alcohol dehydrogenase
MGTMTTKTAPIVESVEDRWPSSGVPEGTLDQLVLASNLLGSDRRIANFGGGNTSAKGIATDHLGRETRVMWVKGSGSDLATMQAKHFTGLRMEEMEPLIERAEMNDADMVAYLAKCMVDPTMPRSSIETLLHAFIPAAHVHHSHPDGINVIAGTADGEAFIRECFGDEAAWIPYIRPGFLLSKQVGEAVRANPKLKLVVLAKHGLVCWGDTAEEAYKTTVDVINKAAAWVEAKTAGLERFGGRLASTELLSEEDRDRLLVDILPVVRGAVSSERHKILTLDTSDRAIEFASSRDAAKLVAVGAACPDHLVHTKRVPLWIPFDPITEGVAVLGERIKELAEAYRVEYRAYVAGFGDETTVQADPDARVVIIQHVGLISVGINTKTSGLSRDLYHRAIEVMAGAEALGEFVSLSDEESFHVEYWPLELYKLSLAPAPGELQGQVAFVTGAAGGIGGAIAEQLVGKGAVVVGFDLDGVGAARTLEVHGDAALAVAGDVTKEDAVAEAYAAAIKQYGGVDILVSNAGIASSSPIEDTSLEEWERNHRILVTGYFLVAREAFKILRRQANGGSIIFIASKNSLVAGKNASAYSSAKAAELHLARCLAEEGGAAGIRVNTVNPDAVLSGSKIWGPESSWRKERADAYGIAPMELEEHYRQRNTLKVNILPSDIANAVVHFASPARSGKSTGNILNVDGGVPAAYSR